MENPDVMHVGIRTDDPSFVHLPRKDQDFIASLMHVEGTGIKPMLERGQIVGYAIPLEVVDAQVKLARLVEAIDRFNRLVHTVRLTAKVYEPKKK